MMWKSTQKKCRSKILMREKVTTRQEAEHNIDDNNGYTSNDIYS